MPGWVKQGSILTQIPCSYHFTCHSSSPCTPQRSTRTSAFPWDSAVVCGFRTAYTPGKQQRGTTETDPRGKQPAPRTWQPHHTRFAGWLCWPGGGLTLTRHRGSTLTALPEHSSHCGLPRSCSHAARWPSNGSWSCSSAGNWEIHFQSALRTPAEITASQNALGWRRPLKLI